MPNHERVEQLFATVASMPASQRSAYLNDSTATSNEKKAVARLLRAHDQDANLLDIDIVSDVEKIDAQFFSAIAGTDDFGLEIGSEVDGFEIIEELGRGGMSIVYRAEQHDPISRQVALKIVNPNIASRDAMQRFLREQQALALVRHPHIATLYSAGQADGKPYAAMEYVDGLSLNAFCDANMLSLEGRLLVFRQIATALHHSHENGVLHRDVKPENIVVYREQSADVAKLIDFGVAKLLVETPQTNAVETRAGQLVGSPRYMSPEQLTGASVDARSDVYSAGLVLFELVAGSPYRGDEDLVSVAQSFKGGNRELASDRIQNSHNATEIASARSTNVRKLTRFVRRDLDWVINKAIAVQPDERYQSMAEMVRDLDAVLAGRPAAAARPSWIRRISTEVFPYVVAIAATALFGAGILGLVASRNSDLKNRRQIAAAADNQNAANDFVMRLLASDMYELKLEDYNTQLIPAYAGQIDEIEARGGPATKEECASYAIQAVLNAMHGDFDASDRLFAAAVAGKDADVAALETIRSKVVSKYKEMATAEIQKRGDSPIDLEAAIQMRTLGRCHLAEGDLPTARKWVARSLDFFTSQKPDSIEELETRSLLTQVLNELGELAAARALAEETISRFGTVEPVADSERGAKVLKRLKTSF